MPLTRRRLLAGSLRAGVGGLVVAGAAACDPLGRSHPTPRPDRPTAPDPLLELLAAERALLSQYDAVLARFPSVASVTAVRADHAAHVDALRAVVRAPATSASASPTPPVAAPATLPAAMAALRAAEVSAAARTTAACIAAPASRAALLGSIAACESAHLVILR